MAPSTSWSFWTWWHGKWRSDQFYVHRYVVLTSHSSWLFYRPFFDLFRFSIPGIWSIRCFCAGCLPNQYAPFLSHLSSVVPAGWSWFVICSITTSFENVDAILTSSLVRICLLFGPLAGWKLCCRICSYETPLSWFENKWQMFVLSSQFSLWFWFSLAVLNALNTWSYRRHYVLLRHDYLLRRVS